MASEPDSTRDFFAHSRWRRIDRPDTKGSLFSPYLRFTQIPESMRTFKSRSGCIAADDAGPKHALLGKSLEP